MGGNTRMKKALLYVLVSCMLVGLGISIGSSLNTNDEENLSSTISEVVSNTEQEDSDKTSKEDVDKNEEPEVVEDTSKKEDKKEKVYLEIKDIKISSDSIGTPQISTIVKNTGKTDIDAFDVIIKCYDKYDKLLSAYGYGEEYFAGTSQDDIIKSKKTLDNDRYWSLYGFDTASRFEVAIIKYHDVDGNTVNIDDVDLIWVSAEK